MTNLERLKMLKAETDEINARIENENKILREEKAQLTKDVMLEFFEELKELSQYGSAGDTGYHFKYVSEECEIYHEATENGYKIKFWLPGAGFRIGKYNDLYTYGEKYWEVHIPKEVQEYIVSQKQEILDRLASLIAKNLSDAISDSSVVDENKQLKEQIAKIKEERR